MNNAQNISVSVIMPVYNVEPYIRKCLDTLLSQTLKNIEVIAIDDGSDDNSYGILKEYAERDSRMTAMKNPYNIGAARTRNIGIQLARGKYVAILDSDDFFELDFLKKMFERAEATKADLVICNMRYRNSETGDEITPPFPSFLLERLKPSFTPNDISRYIFLFPVSPFNKLVLRSFLVDSQILFQDLSNSNDVFWGEIILVYAKIISYIDIPLVHYNANRSGNISSHRHINPLCSYNAVKKIYDFMQNINAFETYRIGLHTLIIIIIIAMHSIMEEKEKSKFLSFWREKGLLSLGMNCLGENDFMSRNYFLQYKELISEGRISETYPRIFFGDLYEKFFSELLFRNLQVALWGYGKEGKEFIRMAKAYDYTLVEIYDRDESKQQEGKIKSFKDRDMSVNAIIVTNIEFTREIATQVWKQDESIRIFDFAAYLWYGVTFEECEYKVVCMDKQNQTVDK